MNGMSKHEPCNHIGKKDEWLTPPDIIESLGDFDLDPCAPVGRPWDTAKKHLTIEDNGLSCDWRGRVWLNPPYGKETPKWMEKMANHGFGTALIFARTETKTFFPHVWERAQALFFFKGRLTFHHVDGTKGKTNGGAPSVLVAYGEKDKNKLREYSSIRQGAFVEI